MSFFFKPVVDQIITELEKYKKPLLGTGPVIIKDDKDMAAILTYVVFRLIRHFYADGRWYDKMDAEKVCASAIDEFKRRFLHPYEDEAIKRNGDAE